MKIKYDSELSYQRDAIDSILNIFQGQETCESNFTVYSPEYLAKQKNLEFSEIGFGNRLTLSEGQLLKNIQSVQLTNGLKPSSAGEVDKKNLDFTIEMETGTGKTYVYLRTIMELYVKYGFSKHIIVVPSIPIKEGVHSSLRSTSEHFRELYDNVNYNYFVYDSSRLNEVRDFAVNDFLQIMVINIDAFRKSFENPDDNKKKANIIHRYSDSLGYKPLDLIRNTNPVIIIDEPQSSMSTPLSKKAVKSLNPLSIIRYSATHREKVNLMYKLDAVDAYEQKLVKQIEVGSVVTEGANTEAYIRFLKVKIGSGFPKAQLEIDVLKNGNIKREKKWVDRNDDLEQITDRQEYEGYIVKDIHAVEDSEYIDFTSKSDVLRLGQALGAVDDLQIKTALIRKTIEEHLNKELHMNPQGIKVLSLFFIDQVKNYRTYSDEGERLNGLYANIFEEEYKKLIKHPKYSTLFEGVRDIQMDVSKVHDGYFSIDKKSNQFKDSKTNSKGELRASSDDENTFKLIMEEKEKLLDFSSKLRFIFSHSALKEGWDNPNVFQICTLKEAGDSDIRRRQEIGRGLRLCVNQDGERVYGHDVNVLTVMASESYVDFVDNLQNEIEQDTGIRFGILEEHSFSNVVIEIKDDEIVYLGQENSEYLFNELVIIGYIDDKGRVQDKLRFDLTEDVVTLPEKIDSNPQIKNQVIQRLKDAAGRLEIRNQEEKKKVKVNKSVLHSSEFKELWERVKYKTTFSVDFDSEALVNDCIQALNKRLKVKRGKLIYSKASVSMSIGGLDIENESSLAENLNIEVQTLPDIVTYLQNETNLTRKSIVSILTGTDKLELFKINPQKFIEGCIEIINEQMRYHIIDGILYRKVGDAEFYSQELFENEELFGYIKTNLKESDKSPYEYVVYDSKVESKLVDEFEKSENVSVYSKLPSWFRIDTPLGWYNPDWAILWKTTSEEKLYFVVESKGFVSDLQLRPKEAAKIQCGKQHFAAMNSEMIVASSISDIQDSTLN